MSFTPQQAQQSCKQPFLFQFPQELWDVLAAQSSLQRLLILQLQLGLVCVKELPQRISTFQHILPFAPYEIYSHAGIAG